LLVSLMKRDNNHQNTGTSANMIIQKLALCSDTAVTALPAYSLAVACNEGSLPDPPMALASPVFSAIFFAEPVFAAAFV